MNNSQHVDSLFSHEVDDSIGAFNDLSNIMEFIFGNSATRQREVGDLLGPARQTVYNPECIIF